MALAVDQAGRADLALQEREEIEIIEGFMPKQLSAEEIRCVCEQVLGELGAWELDPRTDADGLEAAAALCRSAGYWALPYPVAGYLPPPALNTRAVAALSRFAAAHPEIAELEVNPLLLTPSGAVARYLSFGTLTGDWGGGGGLASAVMWHAMRAWDGRGPATALEAAAAK